MIDTLSDVLSRLRVQGSIFSRARCAAPWGVHTAGGSAAIFHVIVRGAGWVRLRDEAEPRAFRAGDLILFPRGDAHVLSDAPRRRTVSIVELARAAAEDADGLPLVRCGGQGPETDILCGSITLARDGADFLLSSLPRMIHVGAGAGETARWLDSTMRLLASEVDGARPGAGLLVARLAEMLLVQLLRAWIEASDRREDEAASGWLGALADPALARAMDHMHRSPARAWTAAELARRAGMSRSAFYERFNAAVGVSPASYLLRWRMCLARMALRRGQEGLAGVAEQVGYSSEAAFSRAFKRHVGLSPSSWRQEHALGA